MLTTFIGISGLRLIIQKQKKPQHIIASCYCIRILGTLSCTCMVFYCIIKIHACSTALFKAIVQIETCLTI